MPLEIFAGERWTIVIFANEILALDQTDGRAIARAKQDEGIQAYARQGDRLFLYAKAGLRALSLPGLEEAWAAPTGTMAFTRFTLAGERLYLPSAEGKLYIHDLSDGRLVDSIEIGIGLYGRPLVTGDRIIVSGLDQRVMAYRLGDHEKLWEYKAEGRLVDDQPLAIGDRIVDYTKEGGLFALDARSGALLWKADSASAIVEPPRIWHSRMVYQDEAGAHGLSPDGGKSDIGARPIAHFDLGSDNALYLAGPGGIERVRQGGAGESISSEPTLLTRSAGGTLVRLDPEYRLKLYRMKP
jgi:outer membrane protein assembly factor BamB